jgi:hypothetical protein
MKKKYVISFDPVEVAIGAVFLIGLYIISRYSYLAFHTLAELFSIVIGFSLFILVLNLRRLIDNNYLIFIGIAFIFAAGIDLIHALSYKGMSFFTGYDANLPTQLWIAARYVESLSLFAAPFFIGRKLRVDWIFAGFVVLVSFLLAAIFYRVFPDCYIEGIGLTRFKIASEYIISAILLGSLILLLRRKTQFDREVLVLIVLSIVVTIGSELAFTFYVGVYDISNLFGHYLKIVSFYLIYKAIIETGLSKPYNLLFRNLKQQEEALRESEERYRSLVESAPDAIVVHRNNKFIFANQAALTLYGADTFEQLAAHSVLDLVSPREREELRKRTKQLKSEGRVSLREINIQRIDGRKVEIEIVAGVIQYQGSSAIQTIMRDITERKLAEDKLKKWAEQMETTNKELESFSYSVSHDLRAPLRAIDGYTRMILKKQEDKFDEETLTKFNVIRTNAQMMGRLIDDLLTFSRLGRQAMSLYVINMDELVKELWDEQCNANPDRQMELRSNVLPEAFGDRTLIRQVLINLLANAVKFTKNRDAAQIEVGGKTEGSENIYHIKDNGAGFDMKYYDKIFGVFQRLHSAEEYEGTGVGLAIVQRLIHRHGGRIWAEGKENEGATFYFTLPLK